MSPAAIGLIVIFLVIGSLVGWYSERTRSAHSDVKVAKTRLSGGRRTRWRSAVVVAVIAVIVILAFRDAVYHH